MEILDRNNTTKLKTVRMVGRGINEIIDIRKALETAETQGLDLVLVSDDVNPPVVRIQDYKKIEYERKKARKASKQSQTLKEMRFMINISDYDLNIKINKIQKFLEKGDKVKLSVRLKGREKETPGRAYELLDKVAEKVECKFTKIKGPMAMALLEPIKAAKTSKSKSKSSDKQK